MEERKSIPVGKTAEMLDKLTETVVNYGGRVHGYDRDGRIDVEFKDLHSAAAYITWQKFEQVTSLRTQHRPFDGPVVVTFHS